MISLWVPLKTLSLNKWYAGKHYSVRQAQKIAWHEAVGWLCKERRVQPIPEDEYPVKIVTRTFYATERVGSFNKKLGKVVYRNTCPSLDTSNTFTANKLIEDALVEAGVLPDDTPKYVGPHITLPPVRHHRKTGVLVLVLGKYDKNIVYNLF
jgi:hypothetical protein